MMLTRLRFRGLEILVRIGFVDEVEAKAAIKRPLADSLALREQYAPQRLAAPAPPERATFTEVLTHGPVGPKPIPAVLTQLEPLGLPAAPYGSFTGRGGGGKTIQRTLVEALVVRELAIAQRFVLAPAAVIIANG